MDDTDRRHRVIAAAIDDGLLDPEAVPIAAFIDWERIGENVAHLFDTFPPHVSVTHTFAVKANSLVPVLERLQQLGMGAEVASLGELEAATAAGHTPERMVYDSPAKSWADLRRALELGVAITIDNYQELDRVAALRVEMASDSELGIRINPQVGSGSIGAMSTASDHSKFGVPLKDLRARERLIGAYLANPWLRRAHVHVGSQGCPLSLIAEGVAELVQFADDVNDRAGWSQIDTLDIGGGLPVDFETDQPVSAFEEYVAALYAGAPRVFSGDYALITEFGRSILAKHGFIAAYVEYTKEVGGRHIAITHAGAQVATRTVFMPSAWPLRVAAFDGSGVAKATASATTQDVAGPCCFAGDLVAQNRLLPRLDPGDIAVLLDTGAYYASTPFMYNSLPLPPVFGVDVAEAEPRFDVIRHTSTVVPEPINL